MRATLALAGHSLRRARSLILVMSVLFGAFQALAALMAATFDESQLFSRIAALVPPYLRQAFGSSFLTVLSFTGMTTLGYVHFAVMGALVGLAITIGTEVAGEVEHGFSDLLMSRPVARHSAITRSVLVLLVAATATNAAMLAGTWVGLSVFAGARAGWPTPRLMLSLAAGMWTLMLCWGGVALAFGAAHRRRAVAGAGAGLLAVTLYLGDVVARVWTPARGLGAYSPFHYFNPIETVSGRPLDLGHLATLAGIGACGIVVAYLVYARRDL
jgi:hypothetical protein